jgi:hypothetical protein
MLRRSSRQRGPGTHAAFAQQDQRAAADAKDTRDAETQAAESER